MQSGVGVGASLGELVGTLVEGELVGIGSQDRTHRRSTYLSCHQQASPPRATLHADGVVKSSHLNEVGADVVGVFDGAGVVGLVGLIVGSSVGNGVGEWEGAQTS